TELVQQGGIPDGDGASTHDADDTTSRAALESDGRLRSHTRARRSGDDRVGKGILAGALPRRREREQRPLVRNSDAVPLGHERNLTHCRVALGNGARLVEDDRVELLTSLECRATLDEHAELGAAAG